MGATLLGTVGLPAVGASGAVAEATTLHVDNAAGAHCTDGGTGTAAAPFCHVAAAAAVVQPGQTVQIAQGAYDEGDLTITRSGTAAAPITFRGPSPYEPGYGGSAEIGSSARPGGGITVRGAENVRFEYLAVATVPQKPAVLVDGAHDVSFTGISTSSAAGVHITNGSGQVRFARGSLFGAQGPSVTVDGGSTGTVLTTNYVISSAGADRAAILVDGAPNTVVVSNSTLGSCSPGIVLTGASGGATVENNAVNSGHDFNDAACSGEWADWATGITVAQSATAGTKVDYNVVDSRSGGAAYEWAGVRYTGQPAFTAATGQGAHDFVAPTTFWKGPDRPVSHLIDSADENAPGMLATDRSGQAPREDPTVPNTGTGSGTRDRGAAEYTTVGSAFTPAGPVRLLDTREAVGVPSAQAVPAWGTVDLQVAGVAGIPVSGVTAVTMNVTVTDPQQEGHLTVYPHGASAPTSSNLNWSAGQTIPNLVTVPVKDGKVSFFNASGGTVHLIADLAGYHSPKGDLFHAQGPARLLDTRSAVGVPGSQAVPAWGTVDLQVAGAAGVPTTGVTAVTMNVTAVDPQQGGHLTVYPHGGAAPDASNLNWPAGRTIPNLVTVPVKDGKVSFYNASGGTVHLIADLAGYYAAEGRTAYAPSSTPARVMDTRVSTGRPNYRPAGTVPAWGTLDVIVSQYSGTAAVTLNVTVTEPGAEGHLTVYPHGGAAPDASNLNFLSGETIANQVVVPVKDGTVSFYNASNAPVHLVIDQFGSEQY
ncbi:right-handed parallel beta-helix repeat-containing protein [Kitasatospora sp. NPDC058170]|uniref:right-handed parallel beta-helix repeat-containing protein n=1 Tax=Kitasatospora sp. NPDC058170 TaxID=3346364 RepID=UPI0036DD30EA